MLNVLVQIANKMALQKENIQFKAKKRVGVSPL
jgi:hypothetical protein